MSIKILPFIKTILPPLKVVAAFFPVVGLLSASSSIQKPPVSTPKTLLPTPPAEIRKVPGQSEKGVTQNRSPNLNGLKK